MQKSILTLMDKVTFFQLLADEVSSYKAFLETENNEWIVKGFIDVNKNIYTITCDTKVVSKIIEIILIPKLNQFASNNGLTLELPSAQNYYPDLTFKDEEGNLFAVDFKTSYYENDNKVNGLTLGSYWGYFRNRDTKMSMDYPYNAYKSHLVIGILYKQRNNESEKKSYTINELAQIHSVIEDFIFFVQPKWKIALDRPGSGNTRNIGGASDIDVLINGKGVFSELGEEVFDDYWMHYYNKVDATMNGIGTPYYNNLKTYKEYLNRQKSLYAKFENND